MSAETRVGFLIAGVQKCGTSALFDYLREVPALQLPPIKEAHFFDDEAHDWGRPDYRPYHDLFVEDGRLWGGATPIYIYWPNSIERIRAYNPAMKLILLFRDPVQRAWSQWRMEYAKGKEQSSFAWCIREGRARLADADPSTPGHHRVYSYVERGFYGRQLRHLWSLFPPAQTLLLRQDDLAARPAETVAGVCDYLGVELPARPPRPRRVREAANIPYPSVLTEADRQLLEEIYRDDLADFAAMSGIVL
jgi:hypothetical protein